MTDEQIKFLEQLPPKVLSNLIQDYASDTTGITLSTFLLAMDSNMKGIETLEVFDWCVKKIREKVMNRLKENGLYQEPVQQPVQQSVQQHQEFGICRKCGCRIYRFADQCSNCDFHK